MLLPPPIIWKDLGLTNGIDDMEAMDAALPESAADEGKLQLDDPLDERQGKYAAGKLFPARA